MALNLRGSFLRPLFSVVCIATVLCATVPATAQRTALRPRITAQIDNAQRTTLVGARSPRALAANDVGAVAPDMQLHGITLAFSRTPVQQTALDQLAAAQQNPSSSLYHQWITPAQYAAQFGVADADIATVEAWLEQQGFAVDSVSHSRNRISFSGTAGQVQNVFGASLHNYKAQTETTPHFAPSGELSIPTALGAVIQSVQNLTSFRPRSNAVVPTNRPQPQFTAGGNQVAYLLPPDVATVYDVNPVYSSGYNGAGQTIAIVGQSGVIAQDLANYQVALAVPVVPQSLNLIPNTGASAIVAGDETESDLDLEYSSAMAPGATVAFYYVGDSGAYNAFDAINYVVDNNLATVISVSYAMCEPDAGAAYISYMDAFLEQAAVQGQTVVVAAGDYGSLSCMQDMWTPEIHQIVPAVEFPASSPWVVAMGGTQFPMADIGRLPVNPLYWGPAPNGDVISTALSYIPEEVWQDFPGGPLGTGGGGISIYERQPLWQTGVPGIPSGNFRLVPDISLNASDLAPGYLMCTSDLSEFPTGSGSCTSGFRDTAGFVPDVIGGTSVAAPIFAGLLAVLNQVKGYSAGQGLINPALYTLASDPGIYASAFHDIVVGGNACTYTPVCLIGPQNDDYFAGIGYDEASGLGSIDFANLVSAWPAATNASAAPTTTTLTASSISPTFGDSVTLTATVSNGSIGNVTFLIGATFLGETPVNGSGVATLSLSTLSGGENSISATYGGTTGYSTSTSTPVTVAVAPAATSTALYVDSNTISPGWPLRLTATISAPGAPLNFGIVTFLSNGSSIGTGIVSGGFLSINITTLPLGANSITVAYNGAPDYVDSVSAPYQVTSIAATTTTTLSASATSSTYGSNVTLTATVSASNSPSISGLVTFLSNGYSIGSGIVNSAGIATLSLSTLPGGSDSITAEYVGTSSYTSSTSTAVLVAVSPEVTTTSVTASTTSPVYASVVTLTAAVAVGGVGVTSGVVTFSSNGSAIGTGSVNSNGVSTISLSTLQSGADSITASYGGTTSFAASASNVVLVTVAAAPTNTALSASSTTPAYGASVTFSATVTANGGSATSGVVTFSSNGSAIGTGSVNNGVATISLATLPSGADSIGASYGGTTSFAASSSTAVLVTVAAAPTNTVLSTSSTSPAFGSSVTFVATVTNGGSSATGGVVTFSSNGSAIGTGSINSNGVATISLATLPSGADSISASYGGTTSFAASASNTVLLTVAPATTTTTLTVSSASSSYGASVTFSATVTANGSPATNGVVTFHNGATTLGTGMMNSNGVASITLTTLPIGNGSIFASYGGTSSFGASLSNVIGLTVAAAPTITVVNASSPSFAFGSSVTLSATVDANGVGVTSGVVNFLNGGSPIGSGTVNNGVAAISLTTLPVGSNSITVSYTGTSNFAPSTSSAVTLTVSLDQTTTTLSASSTHPAFGSSAVFTASVENGSVTVTGGTVTFLDGGSAIGTGLINNGVATLNLTTLPVGSNLISASFVGTSSLSPSSSAPVVVSVSPDATTTTLISSSAGPTFGSSVTFTATVSNDSSPATSGVVTFLNGGSSIGTGTVSGGVATISLSTLPSGADSIEASFGGTSNLAASVSNAVLVTVAPAVRVAAVTATALTSSSASATSGDTLTFTAIVTSGSSPVAVGVVQLLEGGNSIGSGTVNGSGVAIISVSSLPVGSDSISASYAGTANFAASLSSAVTETVNAPADPEPPATITVVTPSPVSPGSSTTAAVKLASGSYAGTMTLTCALTSSPVGAQYLPICTVTPSTLMVAANSTAASMLTVQTTYTTTTALAHPSDLPPWGLGGSSAMAGLFMLCLPNRRRRTTSLLALLLVVFSVGAVGCGGGKTTQVSPVTQSTTAGAYTFTVKGTDVVNPSTTTTAIVTVAVE